MKIETKTEYKIPYFNEHGKGCAGHNNYLTGCEYTAKEERANLARCIENYFEPTVQK